MRPYHPSNVRQTAYIGWKVIVLAWIAKLLGVQIHISGLPFGSSNVGQVPNLMGNSMASGFMAAPIGGDIVRHPSGVSGPIEAVSTHPDGKTFARIRDQWLPIDECVIV